LGSKELKFGEILHIVVESYCVQFESVEFEQDFHGAQQFAFYPIRFEVLQVHAPFVLDVDKCLQLLRNGEVLFHGQEFVCLGLELFVVDVHSRPLHLASPLLLDGEGGLLNPVNHQFKHFFVVDLPERLLELLHQGLLLGSYFDLTD